MAENNGYDPNQKRDTDGKWTDGAAEGNKGYDSRKDTTSERLKRIPRDFFGKKNKDNGGTKPKEISSPPKEAFGFRNDERRNTKHHLRHVEEMGFKNQKEYERSAIDFWNKGNGKIYYSERRENYCKIGSDGKTVCFCDSEGYINSFYKYPTEAKARSFMKLEKLRGI